MEQKKKKVIRMPKRYGFANLISYALVVVDEVIGE